MAEQPIKPPQQLVRQWAIDSLGQRPPWLYGEDLTPACMLVAAKAARWGWEQRGAVNEAELQRARDEQLEVCVDWMRGSAKPFMPSPELVEQLRSEAPNGIGDLGTARERYMIHAAYHAGADQALEVCCERLRSHDILEPAIEALRAHCRPTPPSLADQGLQALNEMDAPLGNVTAARCGTIRAALERLKELEGQ